MKNDVYSSRLLVPLGAIFLLNMLVVLLFANQEINARVASTCPFFFLALSELSVQTIDKFTAPKSPEPQKSCKVEWDQ